MGLLSPFSRCFYHQARQVFDRPASFWTAYYLDLAIFAYGTIRLLFLAIILDSPKLIAYFRPIDPAVASFAAVGGSSLLMSFMWIFEVFHIFSKISLAQIDVTSRQWRFLRAVDVQLQDDYYRFSLNQDLQNKIQRRTANRLIRRLNASFPVVCWLTPRLLLQTAVSIAARLLVWTHFENVNVRRFSSRRLFKARVPALSPAIKRRAVLLMLGADKIIAVIQALIALTSLSILWTSRAELFLGGYPTFSLVLITLELFLLTYTLFRLIHTAVFFTNSSLVATLVHGAHLTAFTQASLLPVLARVRRSSSKVRRRPFAQAEAFEKVISFLTEHNTIAAYLMLGNRQLWGPVLAAFLLTNIPINVYALGVIIFSGRRMMELTVLFIVLVIQLIAFAFSMWPLAYTCRAMHEPQSRLVALQPYLIGPRWTRLKLKLDDLKCRLSCGPKITVTMGPAKDVTSTTIVELLGFYLAFLLMVFSQQLKKEQQL